jgi:hypothetical protein
MPRNVEKTVPAKDIRKKDRLLNAEGVQVVKVDTKVKYTYLEIEDEGEFRTVKYEADQDVPIVREELTEQEKAQMNREFATIAITELVAKGIAAHEKARQTLVDHLEAGYRLSERTWTYVADVIETEYRLEKVQMIQNVADNDENELDIVDGALRALDKITHEMVENRWRGGSSAGFSRAEDESRREAASRLYSDLKMYTYGVTSA